MDGKEKFSLMRTSLDGELVCVVCNKSQFKFAVKDLECYSLEDAQIHALLEISLFNPGVVSLDLRHCNLSDASVMAITQHCTGLQSFCNLHCDGLPDISIASLVRNCPALKELHLSECFNLSNASMLSIAKHCPGLQVLDLGECIINDIGIMRAVAVDLLILGFYRSKKLSRVKRIISVLQ